MIKKESKHHCKFCSFKGKSDNGLRVHVEKKHNEQKSCTKCDPLNLFGKDQQRCIKCFPVTESENHCEECHEDFKNFDRFVNHTEFMHVNEIYKCEKCEKTFETMKSLYRHVETDHCNNVHY